MQSDIDFEYGSLSQALSEVQNADMLPVGTQGKIFSALDRMRAARAPRERIDAVEKISVSIHRLELARRRRDMSSEQSVREQFQALVSDWIKLP